MCRKWVWAVIAVIGIVDLSATTTAPTISTITTAEGRTTERATGTTSLMLCVFNVSLVEDSR